VSAVPATMRSGSSDLSSARSSGNSLKAHSYEKVVEIIYIIDLVLIRYTKVFLVFKIVRQKATTFDVGTPFDVK
jgi:hypothetical protein